MKNPINEIKKRYEKMMLSKNPVREIELKFIRMLEWDLQNLRTRRFRMERNAENRLLPKESLKFYDDDRMEIPELKLNEKYL